MFLIERLRKRQGRARGQAESAIGFALQAGQVIEQRGHLRRRLGLFGDGSRLSFTLGGDSTGGRLVPDSFGAGIGIVVGFLEGLVEPAAVVLATRGAKRPVHFPVATGAKCPDLLLAIDQDGEGRCLNTADRRELEAARLRIERGHGPRTVDADQPVGFRPAHRGIGERTHRLVRAQLTECIPDRALSHRLQPQPLDRLGGLGVLRDIAEDQLTFPARIAGVHQRGHILALQQLQQQSQTGLCLFDRLEREFRRYRGQVRERPLAALDLLFLGHAEFEQMADRRRQHISIVFEIVGMARKAAQRTRDIRSDGRLLGDDQALGHRGFTGSVGKRGADNSKARLKDKAGPALDGGASA